MQHLHDMPFYLFCFCFFCFIVVLHKNKHQDLNNPGDPVSSIINEKGCLAAGEDWLTNNLIVVAGVAVGIAFLQVCRDIINCHFFISYKISYYNSFCFVQINFQTVIKL